MCRSDLERIAARLLVVVLKKYQPDGATAGPGPWHKERETRGRGHVKALWPQSKRRSALCTRKDCCGRCCCWLGGEWWLTDVEWAGVGQAIANSTVGEVCRVSWIVKRGWVKRQPCK